MCKRTSRLNPSVTLYATSTDISRLSILVAKLHGMSLLSDICAVHATCTVKLLEAQRRLRPQGLHAYDAVLSQQSPVASYTTWLLSTE